MVFDRAPNIPSGFRRDLYPGKTTRARPSREATRGTRLPPSPPRDRWGDSEAIGGRSRATCA